MHDHRQALQVCLYCMLRRPYYVRRMLMLQVWVARPNNQSRLRWISFAYVKWIDINETPLLNIECYKKYKSQNCPPIFFLLSPPSIGSLYPFNVFQSLVTFYRQPQPPWSIVSSNLRAVMCGMLCINHVPLLSSSIRPMCMICLWARLWMNNQ